ncbi:related to CDC14 - dual specificity phosphatase [Ustilago sp. UG-2017a]|nr:related to CDC14 - dual specificity phosphatase [Ustilago sp. UG-2017a]
MASTSAFVLEEPQTHIIAPDDSDFLESDTSSAVDHSDQRIESAILEDLQSTRSHPHHRSRTRSPHKTKLWPAHPLIRIHKRLWFTYFSGSLPTEDSLNINNGQSAAWKNFTDSEVKKYVDPSETNPKRLHWFNIDHDLVYLSFWFDWGPLNVAMFYRFCLHVHHMLNDPDMDAATMVLYTSDEPARKANAALLVTMYAMVIGKCTPADAFYPIAELEFKPFRDAGYGRADYSLGIQDVLYGVNRGLSKGLLDLTSFNLDEYEKYEQVANGDWNWITPNFIAFASPNDRAYVEALRLGQGRLPASYSFRPPEENKLFGKTIRYFKERGVKLVVRLNNPLYDRDAFLNAGIDHADMYFDDGSNPTQEILEEFIAKADRVVSQGGVVAVHCKAGLGRTGVLIGAYLVWKHGFSAGEVIAFMRFMRPGCVVGPQQHFIYQNFVEWVRWGVRDAAMSEARSVVEAERTRLVDEVERLKMEAKRGVGEGGSKGVKRRAVEAEAEESAEEENGEKEGETEKGGEERPRQKRKSDPLAMQDPMTPRAQRGSASWIAIHLPATVGPAGVKPAPCVGQPRKSPSPSRKRPAIQAPATVARLELTSRKYPSATRSFQSHLMLSSSSTALSQVHQDPTTPLATGTHGGAADRSFSDNEEKLTPSTPNHTASPAALGAGVLVESKVNVSPTTTPRASSKAAVINLSPSPIARVKSFERTRSNSISTTATTTNTHVAAIATPPRGSSRQVSPAASPRQEVFRANPDVRERFGLRESSPSPSSTPVRGANGVVRGQVSPVKGGAVVESDADVLGVIDVIPQQQQVSTRKPGPSPKPRAVVARVEVDENHAPTATPVPAAGQVQVVHRAPLTTTTTTAASGPEVLRTIRSKPTLTASTCTTRAATVRKPPTTNTNTAARQASTGVRVVRAPKSVSSLRTHHEISTAPATCASRSVSGSSTTAAASNGNGSRPASRLTAPTAASAARAAAAAAQRNGSSAKAGAIAGGLPARKAPVALSKGLSGTDGKVGVGANGARGRVRRGRRSSTGQADLDILA